MGERAEVYDRCKLMSFLGDSYLGSNRVHRQRGVFVENSQGEDERHRWLCDGTFN